MSSNGGLRRASSAPPYPDYRTNVALSSVKKGYLALRRHALSLCVIPLVGLVASQLWTSAASEEVYALYLDATQHKLQVSMATVAVGLCILSMLLMLLILTRKKPIYIINFTAYKPASGLRTSRKFFKNGSRTSKQFAEESLQFQERIIERSGLGDETYLPESLRKCPPCTNMAAARDEASMVMFGAVRDVLRKTGISAEDVGILVVNCSLFNPTPSLAAMIINEFKMSSSIESYNLSGMGCSAGIIAVDLAAKMLQLQPSTYALVVSTENLTENWYYGDNRSMLLPNCLFRIAASAVVLSNRRRDYFRAKYVLACPIVRTITGGQNDLAFKCIYQMEDAKGVKGIKLTRELMGEAGRALKQNITTLGPLVLPVSEQLAFFVNLIARKVFKLKRKSYIPNFTRAFEHFCIHTGGRAVIEEIEKQLQLPEEAVKPTKETLFRYGNISSASIWYILANIETLRGVAPGDRVWQIGFGSGFKCNSAVWRSLGHNNEQHAAWVDGMEMETDSRHTDHLTPDDYLLNEGPATYAELYAEQDRERVKGVEAH